jgi:hypothetical protein
MEREIKYDRLTKDFAVYVEGQLIGFAANYHAGEVMADQFIFDELARNEPVIPSRDEAHREERWTAVLNDIAALPEPAQGQMIRFTIYTLERIIGQRSVAIAA